MDTLAIFGSTGSIGTTSLNLYKKNKKKFNLLYLSAHNNYRKLKILEKKFNPKKIILTNKKLSNSIILNDKKIILEKNLFDKNKKKIDYVISGVSGYEAIDFNFKLLKITKNLLIANKETIICGGKIFLKKAKKYNCNIIPVDSEHYCIHLLLSSFSNLKLINKIYLPASGGPLLNKKKINYKEKLNTVLQHPNWKMGKNISIYSSNLTNKILELFEANILFKIPPSKLSILIEDQSKVHSIIETNSKIFFSVMHYPSMEVPLSNALNVKNKKSISFKNLNIKFQLPDLKKFPLINLGYKILNSKSHYGMIMFTVFNEKLTNMYIRKEISYGDIHSFLVKAFKNKSIKNKLKIKTLHLNGIKKAIEFSKDFKLT